MEVSTNRIRAMKALERTCGQDCVDWALGLLEQGVSSRGVEMLAGMAPPFNPFEMAELRDRMLGELGVAPMSRDEAIVTYAGELAAEAAAQERSPFASLKEISELSIAEGHVRELNNCYLLASAWEDLLAQDIQWYWPGATLDNIEMLARDELARLAALS